jgi:hypothetical protein
VVGLATGKGSREEARQAALAAAVAELTRRFGFTSQLSYRETSTQAAGVEGKKVEERFETQGPKVRLEAPQPAERFEERRGDGLWDAFVLVHYPLSAIRREEARLRSEEGAGMLAAALALARARSALAEGEVGQALSLLAEAETSPDAEPAVRQQAGMELQRVAGGLVLEAVAAPPPQVTLAGPGEPLGLRLTLGGEPAQGVPVRFAFVSGAGELSEPLGRTDAEGVARCRVGKLSPAPLYIVAAEALLSGRSHGAQPLKAGPVEFRFRLKSLPWRVLVDVAEENLGVRQPQPAVAAALAEALGAAGVRLASSPKAAEVQVCGLATTREGSDGLGWEHAATADVRLQAVLVEEGRVLAEASVHLADFSDSVEQAGVNALKKAGREAARTILEGLLAASP